MLRGQTSIECNFNLFLNKIINNYLRFQSTRREFIMTIVNHPLLCICWYLWISLIPQVIAGLNKENPTTYVTSNNLVYRRNPERRRINRVFQELIQDVLDGMSENQLGTFFEAEPSAKRVAIRMLKHMRSLDYYKIIKNRYLGEKQIENLKNPTKY